MTRTMSLGIVALVAAALSCGGGGSSGGTIGPGPNPVTASFVPDPNAPSPTSALTVTMAQGAASDDLVTVEVNVAGTSGVYGAAFDLVCDSQYGCNPTKVEFVEPSAGSLLEQGSNAPNYTATATGVWPVVLGVSRSGAVPGIDVTTPKTLVNLAFRVKATGTFNLEVRNAALIDSAGQPIPGVAWYAGSLQGS
jgi:hypothetical protein